ncbi:MAG TPA: hypothetical protein VJ653_02245, partial [Acidimicrobiales bacterium]|nr:hypothetical protein [Acidimicrobiales bacterium]
AIGEVAFHTPRWYPQVRQTVAYPASTVSDLARDRGGRIITVGQRGTFQPFAPDVAMVYDVADAGGLSVLFPKDYDRFLRLIDDYGRFAEEFNAAPPLASGDKLASPLLDALDVRTVMAERNISIPSQYRRLVPAEVEPWVYERRAPGAALVVAAARPATEEGMWAAVAAPGWAPAASAAVVGLEQDVTGTGGTVTGGPRSSDRERWEVDAPAGGFLRVGARWDPGWSARVDGAAAKVLRADGIFRGVVVPPGRHTVDFSYRNPEEMRGRLLAGAALLALLALVVPVPRNPRPRVNRSADGGV